MSSMPEINVSEAEKKVYLKDNTEKKIAVCAYCRVSTSKDDQRNSFEAQKKFFDDEFKRHPNWTVRTVFADKGILRQCFWNEAERRPNTPPTFS